MFDFFKNIFSLENRKTQEQKPEKEGNDIFDCFLKLELKIGEVKEAQKVEGSSKLIKTLVDFGDEQRTIVSGIADKISPDSLIGNKYLYITNIPPRKIFGIESQGMILAASDDDGGFSLLVPNSEINKGAKLS